MTLLTAGFAKVCLPNAGGVKNIWLANRTEIDTAGFTLTSGEYSAVTMVSTKVFYKFEFDVDSAEFRPNASRENNTTLVKTEIEMGQSGLSTLMRNALQSLLDASPCGMVAIVEDSNSLKWVVGYSENFPTNVSTQGRPLKAASVEATTGKALSDSNIATTILVCDNNELPLVYTGTVPV